MHSKVGILSVTDFKCWATGEFNFFDKLEGKVYEPARFYEGVLVSGGPATGKTSLLDAVIFALTGLDRHGNTKPLHLIKTGSDILKTTLKVNGWHFTRSLSRKANSTIKIDSLSEYLTPAAFEEYMGYDSELGLCALSLGYFMQLSKKRRGELLTRALPDLSRSVLLTEYNLIPSEWVTARFGSIDLRLPKASEVIGRRLEYKKTLLRAENKVTQLKYDMGRTLTEPVLDQKYKDIEGLVRKERAERRRYEQNMLAYFEAKSNYEAVIKHYNDAEEKKADLLRELEKCAEKTPWPVEWDEHAELQKMIQPLPKAPLLRELPSSDRCHNCGQLIGIEHRRRVEGDRLREESRYEREVAKVHEQNAPLLAKIKILEERNKKTEEHNGKTILQNSLNALRRAQIAMVLENLVPPAVPEEPTEPEMPFYQLSDEELKASEVVIENHYRYVQIYENLCRAKKEAEMNLGHYEKKLDEAREEYDRYERFGTFLRNLPMIECVRRESHFDIDLPDVEVVTDESGYDLTLNGVPYISLSASGKRLVDLAICDKFHDILARNEACKLPRVILADDIGLTSWFVEEVSTRSQLFVTKNCAGELHIEEFTIDQSDMSLLEPLSLG